MHRQNWNTTAVWEDIVGYSRAVRIGNVIEVSGTTAVKDGEIVHQDDAYMQAVVSLQIIAESIKNLGGDLDDVIRTRIYVKNIADWEQIAKAHALFFKDIKPATSMVEISRFIDDRLLVEIEATAIIKA